MIYNIIGLALDLIGVLLLFRFGILPNNLWEHLLMDNGMSEKDEKKHKIFSKIGIAIIFTGFALQLFGSIIQNNNLGTEQNTEIGTNINLGKRQNITTGIIGNLKVKFQDSEMLYQLEINGLTESINKVGSFSLNLEDNDGFKISEINELNELDNPNLTRLVQNDSLYLEIKNSIPYTSKKYNQLKKWNLALTMK
jgi:hypothetical protein